MNVVAVRVHVELLVRQLAPRPSVEEHRRTIALHRLVTFGRPCGEVEVESRLAVAVVRPADPKATVRADVRVLDHAADRFGCLFAQREHELSLATFANRALRVPRDQDVRDRRRSSGRRASRKERRTRGRWAHGPCVRRPRPAQPWGGARLRVHARAGNGGTASSRGRRRRALECLGSDRRCSRRGSADAGNAAARPGPAARPDARRVPAASTRAPGLRSTRVSRSADGRAAGRGAPGATGLPRRDRL